MLSPPASPVKACRWKKNPKGKGKLRFFLLPSPKIRFSALGFPDSSLDSSLRVFISHPRNYGIYWKWFFLKYVTIQVFPWKIVFKLFTLNLYTGLIQGMLRVHVHNARVVFTVCHFSFELFMSPSNRDRWAHARSRTPVPFANFKLRPVAEYIPLMDVHPVGSTTFHGSGALKKSLFLYESQHHYPST